MDCRLVHRISSKLHGDSRLTRREYGELHHCLAPSTAYAVHNECWTSFEVDNLGLMTGHKYYHKSSKVTTNLAKETTRNLWTLRGTRSSRYFLLRDAEASVCAGPPDRADVLWGRMWCDREHVVKFVIPDQKSRYYKYI